jgi:hypothetical protein
VQLGGGHHDSGNRHGNVYRGSNNKMHQYLGMCIGTLQPRLSSAVTSTWARVITCQGLFSAAPKISLP